MDLYKSLRENSFLLTSQEKEQIEQKCFNFLYTNKSPPHDNGPFVDDINEFDELPTCSTDIKSTPRKKADPEKKKLAQEKKIAKAAKKANAATKMENKRMTISRGRGRRKQHVPEQTEINFIDDFPSKFEWKIEKISERLNQPWMQSDSFSIHGYQFQLEVWRFEDKLSFGMKLLQGEYDEYLTWPIPYRLTISVMDQVNETVVRTKSVNKNCCGRFLVDFCKPTAPVTEMRASYFSVSLTRHPGVIKDDCVAISLYRN